MSVAQKLKILMSALRVLTYMNILVGLKWKFGESVLGRTVLVVFLL